jgi:hypothetical protein
VLIETDSLALEQKFREKREVRAFGENLGSAKVPFPSLLFLHFKLELDQALSPEVFM